MSGGPYGRAKAPERQCLPLELWPETDRHIWLAAISDADLLDLDGGARAGYSPVSNAKTQKGYGRWLTWLAHEAPDALAQDPAGRITRDRVKHYVAALRTLGNSSHTILARLQELGEMARLLDPASDRAFIREIAARVRAGHRTVRDKSKVPLSDALVSVGLRLIEQGSAKEGLEAAILHRDGLIIALLAYLPIRRRNLADLRIGETLLDRKGCWWISFAPDETKTHAYFESELPEALAQYLETYVTCHRPLLCQQQGRWHAKVGSSFWVSSHGSPLTQMAIYDIVRKRTRAALGIAINPHRFRDAAATTMAIADPEHVRLAAPLLGHRSFATTERYYRQSEVTLAQRLYLDTIELSRTGEGAI